VREDRKLLQLSTFQGGEDFLKAGERKYVGATPVDATSSDGCGHCSGAAGADAIVHNERDFCGRASVLFGCGGGFRGTGTVWVGEQVSREGLTSYCSPSGFMFL